MRVLLIAYDFPPIPSPQSLRWAYLVRELDRRGHRLRVLTANTPGYGVGGLPALPGSVRVHRVWPGFLASGRLARAVRIDDGVPYWTAPPRVTSATAIESPAAVEPLNWKGKLYLGSKSLLSRMTGSHARGSILPIVRRCVSGWTFPDYRAEWAFWARSELRRMLSDQRPDVVITSHEPAFTLSLGMEAKRRGFPWVADLGDPVLAPYTPLEWRKHALALEKEVCRHADLVTVTSERTISVLQERHGMRPERIHLLTQGFDAERRADMALDTGITFEDDLLELLYTGSFYSFRRIDALVEAVAAIKGVRLTVATIAPPDVLVDASANYPEKIRIIGFQPHDKALELQRRCDVLINIANDDPMQVPGKIYEYLGSGTPILHVGGVDGAADLIAELDAGVCERNDAAALARRLREFREDKRQRAGGAGRPASAEAIAQYSWQALAASFEDRVQAVVRR